MLSEFDLIDRFFLQRARHATALGRGAHLGIGDDCALLPGRPGADYAVSTDMLVAGRHFLADVDPYRLGHKCLAVNLSDLAAMGATPTAFTLALALPRADPAWLEAFSAGLFALAERFGCELVGGDTTAGPLTISITIFGDVPTGMALRRDAARVGDDIWVSGTLGDARLALGLMRGDWGSAALRPDIWPDACAGIPTDAPAAGDVPGQIDARAQHLPGADATTTLAAVRDAMEIPEPRVALGAALRGIAHAAIDLSDGLAGDLGHILKRSGVGAVVDVDAVPRSAHLARRSTAIQRACTLAGGDDYELCITAPAGARARMLEAAARCGVRLSRIGTIVDADVNAAAPPATAATRHAPARSARLTWTDRDGAPLTLSLTGFDHFHAD
ncbi:thiamine-phosphate kinase [Robbsia sp. Bb-Pol-6]|uniref:Thiamine-monophosphate kinase n=1 Tax=Robbsia betulipollinis TaxID=2981849 RepID=A0ABT3ZQQ2_9BURK|nr:thiamine-phosphate kinase [Robbsia betulipollinis]MCY0388888.1 thiamine-phosphate kinase [Robbsia betulipollinis]